VVQDDYYYEIQLTNKQLVFYFLAGAIVLVLSFLAGVMVGRGVESGELQAATPDREARIVAEQTPRPEPPPADELTYAPTLEAAEPEHALTRPRPAGARAKPPATAPPVTAARPAPVTTAPPRTTPPAPATTARPAPAPTTRPAPPTTAAARPAAPPPKPPPATHPAAYDGVPWVPGNFTIQVGAFRERAASDTVAKGLKDRGYPAYVLPPTGPDGLFYVRVGSFTARADAERFQARLRDEEGFQPIIKTQ
jgi:cell division septation protein DedD